MYCVNKIVIKLILIAYEFLLEFGIPRKLVNKDESDWNTQQSQGGQECVLQVPYYEWFETSRRSITNAF